MNWRYHGGGAPTRQPPRITNKPLPQNTCMNGNHFDDLRKPKEKKEKKDK